MQSRRARLPEVEAMTTFTEVARRPGALLAEPGGRPLGRRRRWSWSAPRGGWTPEELGAGPAAVSLGPPPSLRAETAAVAAGCSSPPSGPAGP